MNKITKIGVLQFSLAVIGMIAMLAATKFGIGITPDSTAYIGAARSLSMGEGLSTLSGHSAELTPLTHYPPLYSSVLALTGAVGTDLPSAARWLNALFFGANIFLVGLGIRSYARHSFWLPMFGSFLVLTAPDIARMHSLALTEPLFLVLTMIGLLYLAMYIKGYQRQFLLVSSSAVALAFITRYVGLATVLAGGFVLLIFDGRNLRRRLTDLVIFGVIACTPMGVWAIRNRLVAGGTTDRQFVFHPVELRQFVSGASTAASWLLVGKVRPEIRIIALLIEVLAIAVLSAYVMRARKWAQSDENESTVPELPHILIVFIVCYAAFLIFTASFIDADTVFDGRSLLPVHVAALALVCCVAGKAYLQTKQSRSIRIVFVLLALVFAGSYGIRGAAWLVSTRRDAQGYASRAWKDSPTIAHFKTLPSGIPIYSNGYDAIYYLTGRRAIYLPQRIIHDTGRPNQYFSSKLEEMEFDLREHHGVLVYFYTLPERWFLPSENNLKGRLHLRRLAAEADGAIYTVESESAIKPPNALSNVDRAGR